MPQPFGQIGYSIDRDGGTVHRHTFQQLSVSGIALEVAHRGYVLETGVIVQTGTGTELLASEEVQKAYLGM